MLDCVRPKYPRRVVPSILALAYLGPSFYLDSLADLSLLPLVMWVATNGSLALVQNHIQFVWDENLALTSLIMSMTVNAPVTGLIVFRISNDTLDFSEDRLPRSQECHYLGR